MFTTPMKVFPAPQRDDYGDPLPGSATPYTIGVVVDPEPGKEDINRKNQSIVYATIYDPTYSNIGPSDTVELEGRKWDVDGQPQRPVNPFSGWKPGQIIKLVRVTG